MSIRIEKVSYKNTKDIRILEAVLANWFKNPKELNLIDKKTYNKTTEDLSWAYINDSLHKSSPSPGYVNDDSTIIEQGCDYAVEFILAKAIFDDASEFSFKVRASKIKGSKTNFTSRAKIRNIHFKSQHV